MKPYQLSLQEDVFYLGEQGLFSRDINDWDELCNASTRTTLALYLEAGPTNQ